METSFRRRILPLTLAISLIYIGVFIAIFTRNVDTGILPRGVLDVISGVAIVFGVYLMLIAPGTPFRRYFITLLGTREGPSNDSDDVLWELRSLTRELKQTRAMSARHLLCPKRSKPKY